MAHRPRQPRYAQIYKGHKGGGKRKAELAARIWAEVLDHLETLGILTKTRAALADRYVRARVEYETLFPMATKTGPTKKGTKGGEYADMQYSMVLKLSDQISKMEESLLISPKAAEGKLAAAPPKRKKVAADNYL